MTFKLVTGNGGPYDHCCTATIIYNSLIVKTKVNKLHVFCLSFIFRPIYFIIWYGFLSCYLIVIYKVYILIGFVKRFDPVIELLSFRIIYTCTYCNLN